jgi:hypothetical protein
MLRTLRQHRLVRSYAQILTDAALYAGVVLIGTMLLGQAVRLAL